MCKRGRRTTWEYGLYSEVRTGLSPTNELTRWRSLYFWSVVCKIIWSRRHLPCLIPISKGLIYWRLSLRGNILLRETSLWKANIWVCVIECAHLLISRSCLWSSRIYDYCHCGTYLLYDWWVLSHMMYFLI